MPFCSDPCYSSCLSQQIFCTTHFVLLKMAEFLVNILCFQMTIQVTVTITTITNATENPEGGCSGGR